MKKREQGVLTIEASIVLTLTLFVILFLFSFARVYSAQSMVSHAVLQSSDAMAMESYLREASFNGDTQDVVKLASKITGVTSVSDDSFTSYRSANIPTIAREKFITAISNSEINADKILKSLGVKDGISGVDLSSSRIDLEKNEVIVFANYTIKMQFPIFGMKEIDVTKAAKAKTFGEILFEITVKSENELKGTGHGGGKYKYQGEIEIYATPKYGYVFSQWNDGNTDNPRKITVTGPAEYIAYFKPDKFGVNVEVNPPEAASVSGEGEHDYLSTATVTVTPNPGYQFAGGKEKITIEGHNDGKKKTENNKTVSLLVDQTYTCKAKLERKKYRVTVNVEGLGQEMDTSSIFLTYNGVKTASGHSANVVYLDNFQLTAQQYLGVYRLKGWRINDSINTVGLNNPVVLSKPENVTYTAVYEKVYFTVTFLGRDGNPCVDPESVKVGTSIGSIKPNAPKSIGYIFNGWSVSDNTAVYQDMTIYSYWVTCTDHLKGNCGRVHKISPMDLYQDGVKVVENAEHISCIVCYKCGIFLQTTGGTIEKCKPAPKTYYYKDLNRSSEVFQGYHFYANPDYWEKTYPNVYSVHEIE